MTKSSYSMDRYLHHIVKYKENHIVFSFAILTVVFNYQLGNSLWELFDICKIWTKHIDKTKFQLEMWNYKWILESRNSCFEICLKDLHYTIAKMYHYWNALSKKTWDCITDLTEYRCWLLHKLFFYSPHKPQKCFWMISMWN